MKQDKLFEECLSKVDPEVREYVRTQMDYQLMGLPTDDELEEWYEDVPSQSSARYIRNLAAQKMKEQKQIDDDYLADIKLMRDEYYCELQKLRQEKVEWLEKACALIANYLMEIGYPDDWMRDSPNMMSGEQKFRKAMEE